MPNRSAARQDAYILATSVILVAAVFVLDLLTPRGVASPVLFVFPVLVTLWARTGWSTACVAAACVILTFLGYFLPANGLQPGLAISNRSIATVTILAVAGICQARRASRAAKDRAMLQLADQAAALNDANAQLAQSNTDLEQAVKRRAQAELELLRSNRELEEFAYVAAHDLTAPLRHVTSFLGLLEEEYGQKLEEHARDYIHTASRSAKHMQALIHDLLTLARVNSHNQPPQLVDCNAIFDQALVLLAEAIEEAQATITRDPMPRVMGVQHQLVQVFENLIGNALKYRGQRPPKIHVSAVQRDAEWVLCVCDNGIGIDPNHRGELFKIFHRLHSSDVYPGTGIGLALCQRIIERHKGRIWLEQAQPSCGSTFCFSLPKVVTNDDLAA